MQTKTLALAALATTVFAQNANNSLNDTLTSQPSLSNLTSFLTRYPQLTQQLGSMSNMTILAPNNDAFSHWLNSSVGSAVGKEDSLVQGILTYHVLNGTHPNITNTAFFPTALQPPQYCNVTGGQVVQAVPSGNNVTFYSGSLDNSTLVSSQPLNFSGGVVHIIDRFLNLPIPAINTAEALNLTAVSGVIQNLGLTNRLDQASDVTLFLPNNNAFQAVGNILANATNDTLSSIVTYHAIVGGQPLYSTDLQNGSSYKTTQGQNVTIRQDGSDTYVNGAKILIPDILTNNGVIHVIEEVLNPQNSTQLPDTSATTEVGFANATSVSNVPFTSGISAPTSVIATSSINSVRSSAIASASSSNNNGGSGSSSHNWGPKQTGAVGAAALFGGAAVFLNM